jgi:PTS system galactitol-specific IIC component
LSLVTGALSSNLTPIARALLERFDVHLTYVDAGWAAAAGVAFSTEVGAVIIPAIMLLNAALLLLRLTKTVNIDIWNYWHYAFVGSCVYVVTNSYFYGFLGAGAYCFFSLRMADYTAKNVHEVLGLTGVSIPQAASMSGAPIAMVMDKIYDRIPGFKDLKTDAESINKKLGMVGDPIIIGFVLGFVLGLIGGYDLAATARLGINLGAIMVLLPRMVKVVMEGLMPISEGARDFMKKHFSGREYYIGLDSAVTVGHATPVAISVLIIPFYILFAIILPGNECLPFGALASTVFAGATANYIHKGDFLRTYITTIVSTVISLYVATIAGPAITQVAQNIGYVFPEGATGVTYMMTSWVQVLLIPMLEYKSMGVLMVAIFVGLVYWFTREKPSVQTAAGEAAQ